MWNFKGKENKNGIINIKTLGFNDDIKCCGFKG